MHSLLRTFRLIISPQLSRQILREITGSKKRTECTFQIRMEDPLTSLLGA
jgi:hypothetical protein